MKTTQKILIGGQALLELGSTRGTNDVDYLVEDKTSTEMFICDKEANIDYLNANGNKFSMKFTKLKKEIKLQLHKVF